LRGLLAVVTAVGMYCHDRSRDLTFRMQRGELIAVYLQLLDHGLPGFLGNDDQPGPDTSHRLDRFWRHRGAVGPTYERAGRSRSNPPLGGREIGPGRFDNPILEGAQKSDGRFVEDVPGARHIGAESFDLEPA